MRNYWYIASILLLLGCTEKQDQPKEKQVEWDKYKSSEMNKGFAEKEARDIQLFLEMRPDWKVEETGSGLRIWIYKEGEGAQPVPGDIAEIEYEISLLSGEVCYGTAADEYEEVQVDQSEIETGVQEALKRMHVGDEAKLIIPSHLGHGLLGDFDKIPPLRSLVVDLKLIGIKK